MVLALGVYQPGIQVNARRVQNDNTRMMEFGFYGNAKTPRDAILKAA